jgi:ssDNA-binding Zn-finger/Zn-ribbon topoisomerase 1
MNTTNCNECGYSKSLCKKYGGYMNRKTGKYGDFLGCSNYAKTGCNFTVVKTYIV